MANIVDRVQQIELLDMADGLTDDTYFPVVNSRMVEVEDEEIMVAKDEKSTPLQMLHYMKEKALDSMEKELNEKISETDARLNEKIDSTQKELGEKIDDIDTRLSEKIGGVKESAEQSRQELLDALEAKTTELSEKHKSDIQEANQEVQAAITELGDTFAERVEDTDGKLGKALEEIEKLKAGLNEMQESMSERIAELLRQMGDVTPGGGQGKNIPVYYMEDLDGVPENLITKVTFMTAPDDESVTELLIVMAKKGVTVGQIAERYAEELSAVRCVNGATFFRWSETMVVLSAGLQGFMEGDYGKKLYNPYHFYYPVGNGQVSSFWS